MAASLAEVTDSLSARYRVDYPDVKIRFNVGATSTLARQIEFGAAADYFLSADTVWSTYLVDKIPGTSVARLPVTNSLVVVSAIEEYGSVAALQSVKRVAIADPSHVPAGRYAKQALECLGIWSSLKSRVVPTADVRAALAAAVTGSVDAAIVYATDIVSVSRANTYSSTIPGECQSTVLMDIVSVSVSAGDVAAWKDEWRRTILSHDNQEVWAAFGFQPQGRE